MKPLFRDYLLDATRRGWLPLAAAVWLILAWAGADCYGSEVAEMTRAYIQDKAINVGLAALVSGPILQVAIKFGFSTLECLLLAVLIGVAIVAAVTLAYRMKPERREARVGDKTETVKQVRDAYEALANEAFKVESREQAIFIAKQIISYVKMHFAESVALEFEKLLGNIQDDWHDKLREGSFLIKARLAVLHYDDIRRLPKPTP